MHAADTLAKLAQASIEHTPATELELGQHAWNTNIAALSPRSPSYLRRHGFVATPTNHHYRVQGFRSVVWTQA